MLTVEHHGLVPRQSTINDYKSMRARSQIQSTGRVLRTILCAGMDKAPARYQSVRVWVRKAASANPKFLPNVVDFLFNLLVHGNSSSPFALGFPWPFMGCINAHFGAEPGNRRGKIQIINRGIVHHGGVSAWVD